MLRILYQTNTFRISSGIVTYYLPKLILPQRLHTITAMEFIWDICYTGDQAASERKGWAEYRLLASSIATHLPALKRLYVSMDIRFRQSTAYEDDIEGYEQKVLDPFDEAVRRLGSTLSYCQLALPYALHKAFIDSAESAGMVIREGRRGVGDWRQRLWRSVPMSGNNSAKSAGYWIQDGVDDIPITIPRCFGP